MVVLSRLFFTARHAGQARVSRRDDTSDFVYPPVFLSDFHTAPIRLSLPGDAYTRPLTFPTPGKNTKIMI
jgi:hypothetical protein